MAVHPPWSLSILPYILACIRIINYTSHMLSGCARFSRAAASSFYLYICLVLRAIFLSLLCMKYQQKNSLRANFSKCQSETPPDPEPWLFHQVRQEFPSQDPGSGLCSTQQKRGENSSFRMLLSFLVALQGRCQSRAGGSWIIYLHLAQSSCSLSKPNEWDLQEVRRDVGTVKEIWADSQLNPWRSKAISLLQDCTEK